MSSRAFLALGANLGDRERALAAALADLAAGGAIRVRRVSSIYETEPLASAAAVTQPSPPPPPRPELPPAAAAIPWYLNQVAEVETGQSPRDLLRAIHATEARLGRAAARPRWAPREIDIDILAYGDAVLCEPDLVLPHPGLTSRRFVLVPLAEIAPDFVVSATGRTVAEHLSALNDPLRVLLFRAKATEGPA